MQEFLTSDKAVLVYLTAALFASIAVHPDTRRRDQHRRFWRRLAQCVAEQSGCVDAAGVDALLLRRRPAAGNRLTLQVNDRVEARERARLVHRAIEALPPKHRAVVVLRTIEGYSTEETAEMLGVPYGTVLSRLSRAHTRLKELLQPFIEEEMSG